MSLAPGTRLGAYEIVALLGAGGMGEVYRARDTRLGREVAIKVIPPALSADTDLWALPLFRDRKPFPFLTSPFAEIPASFSPDGRWVSYGSSESGRPEVYVTAFPERGGKWQVSSVGAQQSTWRHDGRELIFAATDGRIMAVPVTTEGNRFGAGASRQLFQARQGGIRSFFAVTSDGRFLVNNAPDSADTLPITLVVNWHSELGKK